MPWIPLSFRNRTSKGLTLVEMLMAIFIVSAGMLGFTLLFSSSWKSNKFSIETGVTVIQVNRALNQITMNLRKVRQADDGDYPIESGSSFDLKVYADVDDDGTTERLHYWLDTATDQVKLGITDPVAGTPPTYPSGDTTTRVIANYIVNDATQPLFYYYNANYPGDTTNNPLATPVDIHSVRLVRVLLRMNIDPVRAPNNINVESFVDLRNLENYEEL